MLVLLMYTKKSKHNMFEKRSSIELFSFYFQSFALACFHVFQKNKTKNFLLCAFAPNEECNEE